jgi:hypothetical protein
MRNKAIGICFLVVLLIPHVSLYVTSIKDIVSHQSLERKSLSEF